MEEEKSSYMLPAQCCSSGARVMSSEIVEIGEDSRSSITGNSGDGIADVYVAVGKDDLYVLKWALDHAVSPGTTRVFLVHVFSPVTYITTPVGRLSRSQLSQDQVRFYINDEQNRRRNLLQKYIRLCNDAKVTVDTMLIESNETAKAILELIPVLNITNLVMGTTRPPRSRLLRKKIAKAEFVKKNAPEYCEVTIVQDSEKNVNVQQATELVHPSVSSGTHRQDITRNSEKKFFECACFSVCRGKMKSRILNLKEYNDKLKKIYGENVMSMRIWQLAKERPAQHSSQEFWKTKGCQPK